MHSFKKLRSHFSQSSIDFFWDVLIVFATVLVWHGSWRMLDDLQAQGLFNVPIWNGVFSTLVGFVLLYVLVVTFNVKNSTSGMGSH